MENSGRNGNSKRPQGTRPQGRTTQRTGNPQRGGRPPQGRTTQGNRRPQQGSGRPQQRSPQRANGQRKSSASRYDDGRQQRGSYSSQYEYESKRSGVTVRRKNEKNEKINKAIKIVGYIACAIQLIFSIVATIYIIRLKLVPTSYIVTVDVLLFLLLALFVFMQKWPIPGIIATFMSVIVSTILVIACFYIKFTYNKIHDMSGVDTKVDNVNVYVRVEDPAQEITDTNGYVFGILTTLDRSNTENIKKDIEEILGHQIETIEFDTVQDLVLGLYYNQTQAIILNDAYMNFVTDTEGFEDTESKIRSIYNKSYESKITEEEKHDDYLTSEGRVFTILLCGVDTRGSSITNSNSDTNILMTINRDTHQILMISTPRDYYVPLSISGGVKDKLTHSGAYGVDVTMDTLEMLYGVNVEDYVRINFDGFIDVIDALGGISVYSDCDFVAFDNDVTNLGDYPFHQGYNEVDGAHALLFARERHAFAEGDRQRGKNQMAVIEAMIDKALSPQILKNYTSIWNEVSDCVVTSMEYDEIADFVKTQLSEGTKWDVQKYSVTGFDLMTTAYSTGSAQVYVMDPDMETVNQAKEYLRQIYSGEIVSVPEQ